MNQKVLLSADPSRKAEIEDQWIKELVVRKREEIERVEVIREEAQTNERPPVLFPNE